MIAYPLTVIYLMLLDILTIHQHAVLVLIGRLMRGVMSIVHALTPQIQDIHISKIGCSSYLSWPVDQSNLSRLFLLPCCTTIGGYHTSSDNSNSLQQPTIGYRQTSKLLMGASQPRRVKTTTNQILYDTKFWKEKILANCRILAKIFMSKLFSPKSQCNIDS